MHVKTYLLLSRNELLFNHVLCPVIIVMQSNNLLLGNVALITLLCYHQDFAEWWHSDTLFAVRGPVR
jgi:hypothetical protein